MCGYNCNSCGSCSYGSSGIDSLVSYSSPASSSYSGRSNISYLVQDSVQEFVQPKFEFSEPSQLTNYVGSIYSDNTYSIPKRLYQPAATPFLEPSRGPVFVGELSEIKDFVEHAFEKTTGKSFPKDVTVRLLSDKEFLIANNALGASFSPNVLGFAINRREQGMVSEIFIRKGDLAQIMLTIGHELGHVLSKRIPDDKLEEAKAFAFQIAWMRTLKENNIANLSTAINLNPPAKNGVHDFALDFVLKQVQTGKDPLQLFEEFSDVC